MTSSFTLTSQDLSRFRKVVARRTRASRRLPTLAFGLGFLSWFCVGLAVAAYIRLMQTYPQFTRPLGGVAVLLTIATLAIAAKPYMEMALLRKFALAPNGAFLSPQTVSFSADALHTRSASGTTAEIPWSAFLAYEEDDTNHYLFLDAMQAVILPRAAVAPFAATLIEQTAHLRRLS